MRNIRISIWSATALLVAIGVVMVYSSSAIYAYEGFGDSLFFLRRHLLYLLIGTIGTFVAMAKDYRQLSKFARPLLIGSLIALALVWMPGLGKEIGGARRWLKIGRIGLQPSEFAKIALIFYLADWLARNRFRPNNLLRGFAPAVVVTMIVAGLVFLQPDFGTCIVMVFIAYLLFFVSGINVKYIYGSLLCALPLLTAAIFKISYRRDRILAFLNPWRDPRGSGFQIIQSWLALGSGKLWGCGLGESKQKLFYLPQSTSDFIFSILGEELGFIGCSTVIILFIVLVWQGMRVASKCHEPFGRLLSLGLVSMIGLEAIINIGVSTGSIPTKGLPLPFVSFGGSSLIVHMIAIGLILNVSRHSTVP